MNPFALDLTTIAILWVAGSLVLLPLFALAVRFAVLPLLEVVLRYRGGMYASPSAVEERLAGIEAGLARLAREMERVAGAPADRAR